MQKVSETAWIFRLEWSMGGFDETKIISFSYYTIFEILYSTCFLKRDVV